MSVALKGGAVWLRTGASAPRVAIIGDRTRATSLPGGLPWQSVPPGIGKMCHDAISRSFPPPTADQFTMIGGHGRPTYAATNACGQTTRGCKLPTFSAATNR